MDCESHVSTKRYKKAVILGAGGFLGINLANALAEQGFELVCFDQIESPHWPQTATAITGDFAALPFALLQQLDNAFVFHLISSCRPSPSTADAADEVARDLVTTVRCLELSAKRDLRWIFVSSGGTIYGQNGDEQIAESAPAAPICSYGATKLAIEQYFALYRRLHRIDHVVVRLANPYGPWQDPLRGQGIISAILYKAMQGQVLEVWGDGDNVRDYIYVTDAIQGILAAAFSGMGGEIYNIGTGRGLSINQLVEIIGTELNSPLAVIYTAARTVDVRRNVLCSKKLSSHTDWCPTIAIDEGVELTTSWLRQIADCSFVDCTKKAK
jgi:UDP-glucose 4-epimerase